MKIESNTTFINKYFFQLFFLIQILLDYFTVVASVFLGYFVYHILLKFFNIGAGIQPLKIYKTLAFSAGFLFLVIFERFGLYSRKVGILNVDEMKRILQSLLIGSLILVSFSFLIRPVDTPDTLPIGLRNSITLDPQGLLLYIDHQKQSAQGT